MLFRFLTVLFTKARRTSAWWNVKQVLMEEMYYEELDSLDKYFARQDEGKDIVKSLAIEMYEELYKNYYLQPALIRMKSIYDFINGED